jgi:hypothetical protein
MKRDLTAEKGTERAHQRETSTARCCVLEFDDEEIPTVLGGDEGCDDVQLEQAMSIVCSTR